MNSFFLIFIVAIFASTSALNLHMSKTIAVFGGTGATGRECVYQALKQGYSVVTLARDPTRMLIPDRAGGTTLNDPNLLVIAGDVCNAADVEKVFSAIKNKGDESVGTIVALGGKTKSVGPTMLTDGTRNIIDAIKKQNASKRIAVVTSIGTGDSENQAPMMFKALMYTVMRSIFADKNNQEKIFLEGEGKDLDYCIVRPGGLGLGEPTGIINVIDGQAGSIQRADVAAFCLGAVLQDDFQYRKMTPCISSVGGTAWVKEPKKGFDGVNTA